MAPELHSWKEVAEYLRVSVRTAQEWEKKHGMPVKRLPGVRGSIIARASDLDAWKHGGTPAPAPGRARLPYVVGALLIAALSGAGFLAWKRPQPAAVQVTKDFLIVLDSSGREIWRKQFDLETIHYQNPRRPKTWVGDLDDDGSNEVLFVPAPPVNFRSTTPLLCYSHSGEEKWRFQPGRPVRFGSTDYNPPFFVDGFVVSPIRRGGPRYVLANSHHHTDYPTQVSLLTREGKPVREYWHAGYFNALLLHDLDADGRNEIYLAGVNNARKMAELVVLDPEKFDGAGQEPENPSYQMGGAAPGIESNRILFPRTCVNRSGGYQYNAAAVLQLEASGLAVGVEEDLHAIGNGPVFYRFDRNLRLLSASVSDAFLETHSQLFQRRLIDHPWYRSEEERLARLVTSTAGGR